MRAELVNSVSVRRIGRACASTTAAIAVVAWLGWATGRRELSAARLGYIPMAPNTALCFLLLAAALWLRSLPRGGDRRGRVDVALSCALVVALIGLTRLVEFAIGIDVAVDRWFFRVPEGRLGHVPVGLMALFTAVLLVVASASVGLLAWRERSRRARDVGGLLGLSVAAAGAIFLLGYLFGAPLLYGGTTIPMAANTAVAFLMLGGAIVAEAGPGAYPLRPLTGPSVHSRLLRQFLPFVVAMVCLVAWLVHLVTINVGDSAAALLSALSAVLAMLAATLICSRIARRVGGELEDAERALLRAREELEGRVEARTRELRQAKELLEERNRQLQRSAVDLESTAASVRRAHEELQAAHHELKRAESQLVQSETLSAIGKMVAGVAHEINNPLAFVTNNVAVLQRDVGHLHRLLSLYQEAEGTLAEHERELLARIRDLGEQIDLGYVLDHLGGIMSQSRDGLKRIQQIVKGLRDFARIDESERKEVDLNHGIASTVEIMRPLSIQQSVALEMDLMPLPRVTCYPAKVNQVVLNLVANAIDASPAGGLVTVRSRRTARGIEVDVVDEGSGIDPAILDKIFDPFFTTKPIGKGTGLGLSISYGIIQAHGGRIEVEPGPGVGTRFTVVLPVDAPPRDDPGPVATLDDWGDPDESRKRAACGGDGVT